MRGGGQCGLNNYRTLCVPCHKATTKKLAGERAVERARTAAVEGPAKASTTAGRGKGDKADRGSGRGGRSKGARSRR